MVSNRVCKIERGFKSINMLARFRAKIFQFSTQDKFFSMYNMLPSLNIKKNTIFIQLLFSIRLIISFWQTVIFGVSVHCHLIIHAFNIFFSGLTDPAESKATVKRKK